MAGSASVLGRVFLTEAYFLLVHPHGLAQVFLLIESPAARLKAQSAPSKTVTPSQICTTCVAYLSAYSGRERG